MDLLQLKVTRIIPETKDANTYVMEPVDSRAVRYDAGQFLTLVIRHHDHEIRRSYSLASAPGVDDSLLMTIKKVENGEISRHLLEILREGDVLTSLAPAGRFVLSLTEAQRRTVFFIAAGSGITPVFALIKKLLTQSNDTRVVLIYQNHNEGSIIYDELLHQWQQRYSDRFQRIDLLTHPDDHHISSRRLNNGLLEKLVLQYAAPDAVDNLFYCCGPAPFMRMVQFTLRVMGFAGEQIRKENFTIGAVPAPAFTIDQRPRKLTIRYKNETHVLEVSYPSTLLQAALQHGIHLPFSCRGGRCSACVAQCLRGTVKMSINEVLTEKDLAAGLVLTCVGYAATDVELLV